MTAFAIVAVLTALICGALVVLPLLRGTGTSLKRDELDAALYRDQLAEVERDLERGTISAAEAEGAKAEISRRLLAAASKIRGGEAARPAPRMLSGMVGGLCLLAIPVLGGLVYTATGVPGAPDMPLAGRPTADQGVARAPGQPSGARMTQAQAEAQFPAPPPASDVDPEYANLIERLKQRMVDTPDDVQGLRLLASGLTRLQRWSEAWQAYDRLIVAIGPEQADAELFGDMAQAMVMAAGGYVSPEAESLLGQALERDPKLPIARYYAGLSLAQNGLVPEAVKVWEALRADAPADADWRPFLDQMLAQARQVQAGENPSAGPDTDAVAAAEEMTPDERQEMIMGMVSGLEERLLSEGGPPEKWNQLINSYMFLDMRGDARRIAAIARERLTGAPLDVVETEIARLSLDGPAPAQSATEAPAETAPPGPSASDIEAAQEMAPEDRQQMILSMVERLEGRLLSEGGSAEEWFRLMRSYAVLNRNEDAQRIFAASQQDLKGQDAGFLKEQALLLGVITQ